MFGKTDPQQQWSVHAEFTISHPRVGEQENIPQTHTEQGDNGMRMTYTWTTQQSKKHKKKLLWTRYEPNLQNLTK